MSDYETTKTFMGNFTDDNKLTMVIRRKEAGVVGIGELYSIYPFDEQCNEKEQSVIQIVREIYNQIQRKVFVVNPTKAMKAVYLNPYA